MNNANYLAIVAHKVMSCHPEEIRSLREETKEMERARDGTRRGQSPGTEQMMEQWRREIGRELSTLRGHITRAASLSNLEER